MYKIILFSVSCCVCWLSYADENNLSALLDPTRPIGYTSVRKEEVDLNLQAIFFGNGREEAIVNGVAVKVGDKVHGKKIVRINNDAIVYEAKGLQRTLKLRPSIFKK